MAPKEKKGFFSKFLNDNKPYPIITAIAAGLYPVLFYYSQNYSIINSWAHVRYFFVFYILLPIVLFIAFYKLFATPSLKRYQKYVLPFLNVFTFFYILKVLLFVPPERKIILGIFIVATLFAKFLHKHLKKVIVIELILALIGLFTFLQVIYGQLTYDDAWKKQPDNIEQVVFKKKPNVYFFEPDGYVAFSTLKTEPYNIDNSKFEAFLSENNFKTYPGFHSNYNTTIASNGATFTMKHHFYDFDTNLEEVQNGSKIIITDNPVLNAFKNNGYETYFLSETHYFLLNRPKMGYDQSSIDYSDIPFLHQGMSERENVLEPFMDFIADSVQKPKFMFVQMLKPWHVSSHKNSSAGLEKEREAWIARMHEANELLTQMINGILKKDPGAIIIIMADHGGSLGLEYTKQSQQKIEDKTIINSIFSTNLTIHWPNGVAPQYDSLLKSNVNVFRILFSYLSDNEAYLQKLETNESFIILKEGVPEGVYKYIDDSGNYVFEKMEPKKDN